MVQEKLNDRLLIAVTNNDLKGIQDALRHGADINAKNDEGDSSLRISIANTYFDISEFLINSEANLDEQNYYGLTALHYVAGLSIELTRLLVNKGANIHIKDKEGKTALFSACWDGHLEAVQFLINCGADINVQDDAGITPLHRAVDSGNVACVSFLLSRVSNVATRDNEDKIPLARACNCCKKYH